MFRYAVLGSGSSANSYIFEWDNFSFLLDNGFSSREIMRRMKELSFRWENLEFIFLSHIHSDHLKGVESLSRELKLPVVIHEKLPIDQFTKGDIYRKLLVTPGKEYKFLNLRFVPFETYHDALFSLSFYFELGGICITVITDTGKYDNRMIDFAAKSHILLLESNYSEDMLVQGKYPLFLKERIRSSRGHLSNFQASDFLREVTRRENCALQQIYFCHLSKNNNSVEKVLNEVISECYGSIPVKICDHGELVSGIDIQASKLTLVPGGS